MTKKGAKFTEEHKRKISLALQGRKSVCYWKGKKRSEETKQKIKQALQGKRTSKITEFKKGITPWNRGKRIDMKKYKSYGNWQGGKTEEAKRLRNSIDYALWRTAVFMRDDYICQECGDKGGKLEADHIKPFALYPELRFAIDNGRTLCELCHKQTETYGSRSHIKNFGGSYF